MASAFGSAESTCTSDPLTCQSRRMQEYCRDGFQKHGFIIPILSCKVEISFTKLPVFSRLIALITELVVRTKLLKSNFSQAPYAT